VNGDFAAQQVRDVGEHSANVGGHSPNVPEHVANVGEHMPNASAQKGVSTE